MLHYGRFAQNRVQTSIKCSSTRCYTFRNVCRGPTSKIRAESSLRRGTVTEHSRQLPPCLWQAWNGHFRPQASRTTTWQQERCFSGIAKLVEDDRPVEERFADISAVPGPLNLSIASTSQIQEQYQLSKFLQDLETYLKRQLFKYRFVTEHIDPRFEDKIAAIKENPRSLMTIVDVEPVDTKEALKTAVISDLLLNQPTALCQSLPWLLSEENDDSLPTMRNARSSQITYYLYHHFLRAGLASASIAPEFYDCLLTMIRTRGSYYGRTLLSLLPKYFLRSRCPMSLREELAAAYGPRLSGNHHENSLLGVQQLAVQKDFAAALRAVRDLRAFALVWRSVEYYNTISIILHNAEKHCSKKEANIIATELMMLGIATNTYLCQLVLQFAVRRRLTDVVREMSYNVMRSALPSPTLIMDIQKAMKALHIYDDQADPISDLRIENTALERSYAVSNSLIRMRLLRLNFGQKNIFSDMLDKLQDHANVSFLVELGLADHIRSPHMQFVDCQTLGIMLWQYFIEVEFDDVQVMTVYNKFKALLQTDTEMVRMASFPHAHVFNTFIGAFARMSKERLNDALDVLAEVTHHHEPFKNKPQQLPKAMLHPRWLHSGPDGRTHCLLIYGLVRHGQLQAAERCLAELWKKWPDHWSKPCDQLIKAYIEVGKNNRAAWLLSRKINAGFEVTGETMRALAANRTNWRSARRDWKWNRLQLRNPADDESAMDFSDEGEDSSWTTPLYDEGRDSRSRQIS